MAKEIERKFLVMDGGFLQNLEGIQIKQSYMAGVIDASVRVRVAGNKGFITIKGKRSGCSRDEFEYEIPVADAHDILEKFCVRPVIRKIRYQCPFMGFAWDVDVFQDENSGLVLAEIELADEQQSFPLPPWAGQEVTADRRYYNHELLRNPFVNWKDQ